MGLKIHVILLDVRFSFNKSTNDRFGWEQVAWLESKFQEHSDSDLTFIGSGVQMIPDRSMHFQEKLTIKNK